MKKLFPITLATFVLSVAMPLYAQSEPELQTQNQPATQDSQDADVTTSRFKDWALSCRADQQSGNRQCSIFQRLVVQETNQVALNVAIGFVQDQQGNRMPVAIFTFPLGIFLPGGAQLQVDDTEPARLQIERCFRRGCQTGMALDDKRLAQFRAGSQANVKIMQSREQEIDLTVSLNGFSAAYNALTESLPAGQSNN